MKLAAPLDLFTLPDSAQDSEIDVTNDVKLSLSLLGVGPLSVTMPVLAATYLAPLAFILRPDFALWLYGQSGSLKSTLVSIALQHFGQFPQRVFPCDWTRDTENAIEGRLFTMKDALCVIDDYKPQTDHRTQADLEKKVSNIIRNIGNRAGKSRLRADLTQRPVRPPRGVAICTGEALPPGESTLSRVIAVPVDKTKLNLAKLSDLQGSSRRLPHAMRRYLEWLAPRLPELEAKLPDAHQIAARRFDGVGKHLRQPEALGYLRLGFEMFLQFAEESTAITSDERQHWREVGDQTLTRLGEAQGIEQGDRDAGVRYLYALTALLAQNSGLLQVNGLPLEPKLGHIGWRSEGDAHFLPDATWKAVVEHFRASGEFWSVSKGEVYSALERKFSLGRLADGRFSTVKVDGCQVRVLRIPLTHLGEASEAGLKPLDNPVTGFEETPTDS